jgi:hypothetical protein
MPNGFGPLAAGSFPALARMRLGPSMVTAVAVIG